MVRLWTINRDVSEFHPVGSSLPSPTGSSKFLRNIDRAAHRALITEDMHFQKYKLPVKAHRLTLDPVDILQPLLDGPIKPLRD